MDADSEDNRLEVSGMGVKVDITKVSKLRAPTMSMALIRWPDDRQNITPKGRLSRTCGRDRVLVFPYGRLETGISRRCTSVYQSTRLTRATFTVLSSAHSYARC